MSELTHIAGMVGVWAATTLVVLLCLTGIALSCLSLSGTWLVAGAAGLAIIIPGSVFPGWWTVLVFLVLSTLVEIIEAVAGAWGVRKRGGSRLAGVAAIVGGMLGLILGTFIPVPIVGSLIGMLIGSFGLVFALESYRLRKADKAAGIAWGTVIGRVFVILLKAVVTLGMTCYLLAGMLMAT